jgi:hypothetical protein
MTIALPITRADGIHPTIPPITRPGGIQPTIEESFGTPDIENSELRKIAQDVLDAARYALASVAANLEQPVRPDSLESAFKEGINKLDAGKRASIQATAKELANASEGVRTATFGRYGKFESKDFLGMGFARADEALPELTLDKKLLGIKTPTITVPVDAVRRTPEGGLLIPSDRVPPEFEGIDTFENLEQGFEEAREAAIRSEVYDAGRLNELWGLDGMAASAIQASDTDEFEAAATDKLGFYITQVKCVDETNPEFWGSDEIAIGGLTVDETGDTTKVSEKYVGGGFDDGDVKNYSPHLQFTWFNLREQHGEPGSKWPKMYFVTLLLAEKDHGGFSSALQKVWEKVAAKVKEAVEKAITGALSGLVGPAIAAAIGKIAAWIVDKLVGWIIQLFKDDLFPPFVAKLMVSSLNQTWPGGSKTGPLQTAHFSGHGGHYTVRYYWKLYA